MDVADKHKPTLKPIEGTAAPKNNSNHKRKTRAERSCPEELKHYTTRVASRSDLLELQSERWMPVSDHRQATQMHTWFATCAHVVTKVDTLQLCAVDAKKGLTLRAH